MLFNAQNFDSVPLRVVIVVQCHERCQCTAENCDSVQLGGGYCCTMPKTVTVYSWGRLLLYNAENVVSVQTAIVIVVQCRERCQCTAGDGYCCTLPRTLPVYSWRWLLLYKAENVVSVQLAMVTVVQCREHCQCIDGDGYCGTMPRIVTVCH